MAFKCANCVKSNSECKKSPDSSSCIRKMCHCDMEPFSQSHFAKIDRERARIDVEEAKAREAMHEAMTKITRMEKLRRFLSAREAEMIRRGLENVEELEKLEKQEEERQKSAADPSSSTSVTPGPELNFSEADFAEIASLSPSFLETLVSGGTPQ